MKSLGAKEDIVIPAKDISLVRTETSPERGRVLRRIAIYSNLDSKNPKFVDVSLKHFVPEDIRKLMDAIHKERPDLVLPKQWT
jgi:hypothetical protein